MSGILPNFPGICVEKDAPAGVDLMFDYLLSLGHRRIAFLVNEPTALISIRERLRFIKKGIEERGLTECVIIDAQALDWDDSFTVAYSRMDEVMALVPRPTALCPISAAGTWAALRYLTKHRVRVPEELSLFSFDELPSSDLIYPALTSISYSPDLEKIALDLLWSQSTQQSTSVTPKLLVRESTAQVEKSL
jgi:DNA-binding LacI/PurR family transcriptional regulator